MSDTTALTFFDRAKAQLEQAARVDEVKAVRDKAEALRLYYRQQRDSHVMQNRCAEIKVRAERRAGELLKEMALRSGRPENGSGLEPLSTLGIGKTQSHRWQTIASLPAADFEALVTVAQAGSAELTSDKVYTEARRYRLSRRAQVFQDAIVTPRRDGAVVPDGHEELGVELERAMAAITRRCGWLLSNQAALALHTQTLTWEGLQHVHARLSRMVEILTACAALFEEDTHADC